MPYLKSAVVDLGLPDFFNHLIPIVEASLQTPVSNTFTSGTVTTGTINPGVIWVGKYYQVGIEAMIPVNRQSGTGVGAIAQLHFFPRRHLPQQHRKAAVRQRHHRREADVRQPTMKLFSSSSPRYRHCCSRPRPRWRMPCSIAPARRSAARSPPAPREVVLWFTEQSGAGLQHASRCATRAAP